VGSYDLNPPNPAGGMDATKPLIQVVVEYLIDAQSPLVKHQPEVRLCNLPSTRIDSLLLDR
jgi:hypothetical protein